MASRHDILSVLQDVQSGALTPEDALTRLKLAPFEDLGYAKVDYHRAVRQGVPEVIYGQSKTKEQISGILAAMEKRGCVNILVTRIQQETADYLAQTFPLRYEPLAKLAVVLPEEISGRGSIVVATGGTSDIGVAEEAAITAETLGNHVTRLYDVGVAGLNFHTGEQTVHHLQKTGLFLWEHQLVQRRHQHIAGSAHVALPT